jgi:hypothetical protein
MMSSVGHAKLKHIFSMMVVVRQGKSKAICILLVFLFLIGHEEAFYLPKCHGMTTMYVSGYESPYRQL